MPKPPLVIDVTIYWRQLSIPPDEINKVHDFLQSIWGENPHIATQDRHSIETAIIELVSNIILYSVATSGITCEIAIEIGAESIEATISDNGDLADLEIDKHIMPDEFSESGRGIPLIRALVDEFAYENLGKKNTWRVLRKFQS